MKKNNVLFFITIAITTAACSVTRPRSDYLMNNLNQRGVWNEIDTTIIRQRALKPYLEKLQACDWENKAGKFKDVFWISDPTTGQNRFGYIYEYYLDCDSLRFIYWYPDPAQKGKLVDLIIEPIEQESIFLKE